MTELLHKAVIYAARAHKGQDRKYTGLPYITHCLEVLQILQEGHPQATEEMLCAAVLHDVVEDTPFSLYDINKQFEAEISMLVYHLTDHYTKESYAYLNRRERKEQEAHRISRAPREAQIIKLADLISNSRSIIERDPGFAEIYLKEKKYLLNLLDANLPLWDQAYSYIDQQ